MVKYFIENNRGQWMASLDENITWTKDPALAWGFELVEPDEKEYYDSFMELAMTGDCELSLRPKGALQVIGMLKEEGLGEGLFVRKHECFQFDDGRWFYKHKIGSSDGWMTYDEKRAMNIIGEQLERELGKALIQVYEK